MLNINWSTLNIKMFKLLNNFLKIFLLLYIIICQTIDAFNLDTSIPVFKYGPKDSYFGYSVAEHIIKRSSQNIPVLLVGAPRAKTGRVRTGALYRCDLNSRSRDCTKLYVDPDNNTYSDSFDKEDQWLGVTVKSQGEGGYAMVCAHRYVQKGLDYRWGNGICYSLTPNLDFGRTYEPCRGRLVNLAHEQFGYCQAGTSGEISKDFQILIGSPGPYTWRGTVFSNNIRYSIKDDKTWYNGPVIEGKSPVSKYSYLGMSVSSGDFLGDKHIIATGAPRSNGTGQVIFYSQDSGKLEFDLKGILQGEQFASSFGYSMASLDCDGDKHSDLVVGAPFYYSSTEGGAVYVFLHKDLHLNAFDKFQRLTGKFESRFGFALANAGDLNKDNYEDLAVGAPYEKDGVVYIYLGSSSGLKNEPSQIISALDFPSPINDIKTFGYSLSGNLDLDRNSYPDLLVGAYESDAVVLLRSRPIIRIKTQVKGNMTKIDPKVKGCPDDLKSTTTCFTVQPCFQILELSSSLNTFSKLSLRYRIEAETFSGSKYYRVVFKSGSNIVENTVTLDYGYTREYCTKQVIYVKETQNIQTPIAFKLSYSLKQIKPHLPREDDPLPDINDFPILDQEEAHRIFYAKFHKDCGSDDACDTNLNLNAQLVKADRKDKNNYTLVLDDDIITFDISLTNKAEPAYDTYIYIDHSPNISYVGRKISDDQVDCTTISKERVKCDIGNPFTRGKVDFQIMFDGRYIQDYEREISFRVEVETSSNDISKDNNVAVFNAELKRRIELELSGRSIEPNVRFGGEIKGEGAIRFEDEIGDKVTHIYTVTNHGPLKAKNVVVLVDWPYQIDSGREFGKWILYIMANPTVTGSPGYCSLDSQYINPIKIQPIKSERLTRIRRSIKTNSIRDENGNVENKAILSCDSGARCIKITCFIQSIEPNRTALIHIRSRLWNATFLEDFSHFHSVSIQSNGRIILNKLYNIIQNENNDAFIVKTNASPDAVFKPPQASWWWYLVAIIVGLIILSFIICLLYKTGFFKRDKRGYEQVDTD